MQIYNAFIPHNRALIIDLALILKLHSIVTKGCTIQKKFHIIDNRFVLKDKLLSSLKGNLDPVGNPLQFVKNYLLDSVLSAGY